MFATDISSIIEDGYYFQLFERGSTGSKGIKQSCGVIDTSYSGNWFVPLVNVTEKPIVITSSITYKEVEKLLQNTELTDEQRSKLQEQHDDLKALYEFELEALKDWYDENIVDDFDSLWYLLDHKKAQRDWEEWLKTIVFYPTTKAISQAVLLPCYDVNSKEGTLEELSAREEELKKLGDSRGKGALGSSGK